MSNPTRRDLLRGAAASAALACLPLLKPATELRAYAATSEEIQLLRHGHHGWQTVARFPSLRPSATVLSPDAAHLYVANHTDTHAGQPCGSIEHWRVDHSTGLCTLADRHRLALAAVFPTELALSRNGRVMAARAAGGSVLSLLRIGMDGVPGDSFAVRKELAPQRGAVRMAFTTDEALWLFTEHEERFYAMCARALAPRSTSSQPRREPVPWPVRELLAQHPTAAWTLA